MENITRMLEIFEMMTKLSGVDIVRLQNAKSEHKNSLQKLMMLSTEYVLRHAASLVDSLEAFRVLPETPEDFKKKINEFLETDLVKALQNEKENDIYLATNALTTDLEHCQMQGVIDEASSDNLLKSLKLCSIAVMSFIHTKIAIKMGLDMVMEKADRNRCMKEEIESAEIRKDVDLKHNRDELIATCKTMIEQARGAVQMVRLHQPQPDIKPWLESEREAMYPVESFHKYLVYAHHDFVVGRLEEMSENDREPGYKQLDSFENEEQEMLKRNQVTDRTLSWVADPLSSFVFAK